MSRGSSGRIVIEVPSSLKNRIHAEVALEGRSLKDWFVEQAESYLSFKDERRKKEQNHIDLTTTDSNIGDEGK